MSRNIAGDMLPGNFATSTTAPERRWGHMGWQGQGGVFGPLEAPDQPVKPHPGLGNGWPEISRVHVPEPGFKKRKFDEVHSTKVDDGITQQSKNTSKGNSSKTEASASSSKENSKAQKTDYIHVRARRGQATDSHSLAERARREKISQRMKYLQDLVPGCNKITGKAGMLDEIINYVQSLQGQVKFLSMKLAAVNPTINWNIDGLFGKEVLPPSKASIQAIDLVSPEIKSHLTNVQSNPVHQAVLCAGMEPGIDSIAEHRASMSSPSPILEMLSDPPILLDLQQILASSSIWEADLQNLYSTDLFQHGSVTSLASHQLTGSLEISDLKREM